jgi:AcrR family transcriptional regulator
VSDENRGRTHPRDTILRTAEQILTEAGVAGLTVEGVAARSGLAKTTIYRRFRSKRDLALAVVLDMTEKVVATGGTGGTRDQLVGLLDTAIRLLRDTPMGRVMQGLASDIATDPDLSRAFQDRVIDLRIRRIGEIVRVGVEAGELDPGTDPDLLEKLLFGPVYHHLLFSLEPPSRDFAARIVDTVLPGLTRPQT